MLSVVFAPKFLVLYLFIASATYIHLRGKVRHTVWRQLTDHSTFLAPLNTLIALSSSVPVRPMVDVERFPELAPLRIQWEMIRDEALALNDAGQIRPSEKYNDVAFNTFFRRGWKRFYLKWYGDPLPSAQALCPKTVELVQSIPTINAALFTLLPPGARLGDHRDPFAGSLRFHLGLVTPNDDACRIYIDGTPYSWRDGEAVMFDETFIHSAINETDKTRIILFCDIARPINNPIVRAITRFVTLYVVRITATQNVDTEQVGAINRVSGAIYAMKRFFERAKKANRRLYYLAKYILFAGVIYLIFIAGFRR
ncbi:MAG TPA: aspartyl/asparaginyl beta-hydroxylase domain-containing protein [Thermoanaerobaculia bacterium]|nr:aspartyl/asparaginyl beta-hydroxylase domain-containing protein [Thermoanaerobaculia bacterium]